MNRPLRILLVEDCPKARSFLLQAIPKSDPAVTIESVGTLAEAEERLRLAITSGRYDDRIDGVLVDLSLPDADGLKALEVFQRVAPCVPVVVLTGLASADVETASFRAGAEDFFDKSAYSVPVLVRAMRHAAIRREVRHDWEDLKHTVEQVRGEVRALGKSVEAESAILKSVVKDDVEKGSKSDG